MSEWSNACFLPTAYCLLPKERWVDDNFMVLYFDGFGGWRRRRLCRVRLIGLRCCLPLPIFGRLARSYRDPGQEVSYQLLCTLWWLAYLSEPEVLSFIALGKRSQVGDLDYRHGLSKQRNFGMFAAKRLLCNAC